MKSMKFTDAEKSEYNDTVMVERPLYPWGLQLTLDDESFKKLSIKRLPDIDQVLEIRCKAQVTGIHSNKVDDDKNNECVNLQITDMEIVDSGADAAEKLYGKR